MATREQQALALQAEWDQNRRWHGVVRHYTAADVVQLRGSLAIAYTLAERGADKLWQVLATEPFVNALGAVTGKEAVQQVKAGLKAIYLASWPLAGDAGADAAVSDHALYPANAAPQRVRCINAALQRADQIAWAEGRGEIDYFAPIVVDAEAGFGGALNAYQRMQALIDAGAAGVHFDDQHAVGKQVGALRGKVLVPTREAVEKLAAARLAADVMGTSTVVIARTDAEAADLLSADVDANDQPFCTGERTVEGYYKVRPGIEQAVARALAYAPYADLLWCETARPDLAFAKRFAEAVHASFPGKMLAYNCSPTFNWKRDLDDATIAKFQKELGAMGYQFQFISLPGIDADNDAMFHLAQGYARRQLPAFVALQEARFAAANRGCTAVKRERDDAACYLDTVTATIRRYGTAACSTSAQTPIGTPIGTHRGLTTC